MCRKTTFLAEDAVEHAIGSRHQISGPVGLAGLSLLIRLHEVGWLPRS